MDENKQTINVPMMQIPVQYFEQLSRESELLGIVVRVVKKEKFPRDTIMTVLGLKDEVEENN